MAVLAFEIELSDMRRGRYETLSFTVAQHPSESEAYLVTRVLAFALEQEEGLAFSKGGLGEAEEPALSVTDLTGRRTAWIEVGLPSAERLHRASKASDRVAVWPHRDASAWFRQLAGARIHRAADITVHSLDLALIDAVAGVLTRRNTLALTVSEDELFLELAGRSFTGALVERPLVE
ncbi:MAG: YaeQ family protein [Myxococcales bacterium]|nr:YaeQ family protein [Myxococcales bacterium]